MTTGPPRSISGDHSPRPTTLTWSDALGKRVRTGDWSDQAGSTSDAIVSALEVGQWELAAQLIDYFMEEAKVVHVVYQVWTEGFMGYLGTRLPAQDLADEVQRLRALLAFPDGTPFHPGPRWLDLGAAAGRLANGVRGFELDPQAARAGFEDLREQWRQLHDRGADMMSGLLAVVADRFGEAAIGDCYRQVLAPYLEERYRPFDLRHSTWDDTLERNLYLAFESMRGHLVGPGRRGNIDVEETDDAWVLSFAPCGSGGRGQIGDEVEGTPSRMERPYLFGATKQRHDWAGNEVGVCYYCAHCVFALELWPAENWGHPVRTVDPPLWPHESTGDATPCRWTIYKRLEAIPDEAYTRIGRRRPEGGT